MTLRCLILSEERQQRISQSIQNARDERDFISIAQVWFYELSQGTDASRDLRKQLTKKANGMDSVLRQLQRQPEWQTWIDPDNLSAAERIAKLLQLDALEDPELQAWVNKNTDLLNTEVKADGIFTVRQPQI